MGCCETREDPNKLFLRGDSSVMNLENITFSELY